MKTLWIDKKIPYTGAELRSLYNYLEHGVLGDSVIAFVGPCSVSLETMLDGEDRREQAKICGDEMLHFIFEIFDHPLFTGVLLQRLFASLVIDSLQSMTQSRLEFTRSGDDIFYQGKKLSISIAAKSPQSVLVHFAVNVTNQGTPVPTCALSDFGIRATSLAENCLLRVKSELENIREASQKVLPVR